MENYRGWNIDYIHPPIPIRSFDYMAAPADYDGAEDERLVHGESIEAIKQKIDDYIEHGDLP